jgi:hypothetical protein
VGEAFSTYEGQKISYGLLVEKPEERRPLGRPRC